MGTMPPREARCVFYSNDNSGLGLGEAALQWFTSTGRARAHGTIEVPGRRGDIYHLGTLPGESQRYPEWPAGVHEWFKERGSLPDALVVVWEH